MPYAERHAETQACSPQDGFEAQSAHPTKAQWYR
jgi:hypothetical protein